MSFISKQPNGKYCRFSSIIDCPTDINMTEDDYIKLCQDKATIEAIDTLKTCLRPFKEVKESFIPNNMTKKEFKNIL